MKIRYIIANRKLTLLEETCPKLHLHMTRIHTIRIMEENVLQYRLEFAK
jgi:hypothetical protein